MVAIFVLSLVLLSKSEHRMGAGVSCLHGWSSLAPSDCCPRSDQLFFATDQSCHSCDAIHQTSTPAPCLQHLTPNVNSKHSPILPPPRRPTATNSSIPHSSFPLHIHIPRPPQHRFSPPQVDTPLLSLKHIFSQPIIERDVETQPEPPSADGCRSWNAVSTCEIKVCCCGDSVEDVQEDFVG